MKVFKLLQMLSFFLQCDRNAFMALAVSIAPCCSYCSIVNNFFLTGFLNSLRNGLKQKKTQRNLKKEKIISIINVIIKIACSVTHIILHVDLHSRNKRDNTFGHVVPYKNKSNQSNAKWYKLHRQKHQKKSS